MEYGTFGYSRIASSRQMVTMARACTKQGELQSVLDWRWAWMEDLRLFCICEAPPTPISSSAQHPLIVDFASIPSRLYQLYRISTVMVGFSKNSLLCANSFIHSFKVCLFYFSCNYSNEKRSTPKEGHFYLAHNFQRSHRCHKRAKKRWSWHPPLVNYPRAAPNAHSTPTHKPHNKTHQIKMSNQSPSEVRFFT
jgi:hypothetical protein